MSVYEQAMSRAKILRGVLDSCSDRLSQEEIDCVEDVINDYVRVCDNITAKVLTRMSKEGIFNA